MIPALQKPQRPRTTQTHWRSLTFAGLLLVAFAATMLPAMAAEEVPTELSERLNGQWQLAETAEEKQQRLQSIDRAIRSIPGPMQSRARGRIQQRTAPKQEVVLQVDGSTLMLSSGGETLELEIGGPMVQVKGPEGKVKAQAKMDGADLLVEMRPRDGLRTTRYLPGEDRLVLRLTLEGSRLSQPIEFESIYLRLSETSKAP